LHDFADSSCCLSVDAPGLDAASAGLAAGDLQQFLVMLPCRSLLYSSVRSLIRLSALSVAFFIDTMRALCSLALALSSTK
jgi:hypothetical protein